MTEPSARRQRVQSELDGLTPEFLRSRTGVKWSRYPEPVIPAWVADMDFLVAPEIREVLAERVAQADFGYTWVPVPPDLLELFAERQTRYGLQVDPANVVPMVTALQAVDLAIELFSEPGDGVVLQTPIYPPFLSAVSSTRRTLLENPLVPSEGGFRLDEQGLQALAGKRPRILLVCNPHNPTGRSFSRQEMEALGHFAVEHDCIVLSDEIHADLTYADREHTSMASLAPEIAERTITITSATKAFNLAGLPCAFAATGSAALRSRFGELAAHALAHPGALDIAATQTAWSACEYWLDETRAYLDANRKHLCARLEREAPVLRCHLPEATYLSWIDCRGLGLADRPSRAFYKRAGLALHCGHDFGDPGAGFVRLNFATSRSILDEMIDRTVALCQELGGEAKGA